MPKYTPKKYIFIADFFADQMLGGGELNNEELINLLKLDNTVEKVNSHFVSESFLSENINSNFIVSNFINLKQECKQYLQNKCRYVIYEHDHKYLVNRNPAEFDDFLAPQEAIVNYDFYKKALAVYCQSNFHKEIVYKNLKIDNIVNLGGNLWSIESLNKIREFATKDKLNKCSIMDSPIPHKNTNTARAYCAYKNMEYELIPSLGYYGFLDRISNNDTLVFFPKTPETLSRITVEAKMMGMTVITNKLVGATKEKWFELKGGKLIDIMIEKRKSIFHIVEENFDE